MPTRRLRHADTTAFSPRGSHEARHAQGGPESRRSALDEAIGAPPPDRHLPLAVAVLFFLTASLLAICIPLGGGSDEPCHIARVAQLSEGIILPQELPQTEASEGEQSTRSAFSLYGGFVDSALYDFLYKGNVLYQNGSWNDEPFAFPSWTDDRLQPDGAMGEEAETQVFSNTAINSPICYLPYTLAYILATLFSESPVVIALVMRLTGVAFFSVALYFLIRLIPVGKWTLAFCALLPQVLCSFSAVTADLMTFACFAAFVTFVLRAIYAGNPTRLDWGGLAVSTLLLCLVKVTYLPFIALLAAIPLCNRSLRDKRHMAFLCGIAFAGLALFGLWYLQIHSINTGAMWSPDVDPGAQQQYILAHPLAFIKALATCLLTSDVLVLGPFVVWGSSGLTTVADVFMDWSLPALVMGIALVAEIRRVPHVPRNATFLCVLSLGCCVIVAVLVVLALYLQFTPPGQDTVFGVQPRYFLPVAFMVQAVIALVFSSESGEQRVGRNAIRRFALPYASCAIMAALPALLLLVGLY